MSPTFMSSASSSFELVAVVILRAVRQRLHLVADESVVTVPRHFVAGHVGADAVDVEIVWSAFGDDQQRFRTPLRAGGREDGRRRHRAGGKRSHGFEEIATFHAKSPFGFDWSFCRGLRKAHANRAKRQGFENAAGSDISAKWAAPALRAIAYKRTVCAETLGAFVGWVERSETHQSRWVSLRSTHPTTRAEKTTDRHEAGPSLPSPIALFGRGHCVSDRGLRKRGGRIAAQSIEERRY